VPGAEAPIEDSLKSVGGQAKRTGDDQCVARLRGAFQVANSPTSRGELSDCQRVPHSFFSPSRSRWRRCHLGADGGPDVDEESMMCPIDPGTGEKRSSVGWL
jgi:hypothetical protein